jgi:hypothetical protein
LNSIWNENISLFSTRFPHLAVSLGVSAHSPEPYGIFSSDKNRQLRIKISPAKNGSPTAEENGSLLHSKYNPEREAEQSVAAAYASQSSVNAGIFLGCGLGYGPVAFAKAHPRDTIIIVEPDPSYFFTALAVIDWTPVFLCQHCVVALAATGEDVIAITERACGISHCAVFSTPAQTIHAQKYFDSIKALLERNRQKDKINEFTLEKFSHLWLRNSCRNIRQLGICDGVVRYKDACISGGNSLSVLILAAGPTLSQTLPYLGELKKRMIIICVDTALRSCLRAGVEPDFIILVDPQYYAWQHIAGLSSPSSILITESAAYPAVYRFPCKEIILCSSLFPLGKYFESKLGSKGELGAGGSVSTTAWDFARLCGAKEIYTAGLDLGYPSRETHIRGSTFEEKVIRNARRIQPAETAGISSLFGANSTTASDYSGNTILTDDRMKLFAWWFESKVASYPHIHTYALSSRSLAIPGTKTADISSLLLLPQAKKARDDFFSACSPRIGAETEALFNATFNSLIAGFDLLYSTAKKGEYVARKALEALHSEQAAVRGRSATTAEYTAELDRIDSEITHSEFKDAVSLVFPSEKQLNTLFAEADFVNNEESAFIRSRIIYRELQKAISQYRDTLLNH